MSRSTVSSRMDPFDAWSADPSLFSTILKVLWYRRIGECYYLEIGAQIRQEAQRGEEKAVRPATRVWKAGFLPFLERIRTKAFRGQSRRERVFLTPFVRWVEEEQKMALLQYTNQIKDQILNNTYQEYWVVSIVMNREDQYSSKKATNDSASTNNRSSSSSLSYYNCISFLFLSS